MEIFCRAAREADTADVVELTSTIWDGHDYVPRVWPEWLEDPLGILAVAEYQGRVIGVSKLSQSAPGEWWLQGLRVHPDYQGQGVAARLHDYVLEYWQSLGPGAIRLATSALRVQVHHLCERTGFRKVGEYTSYSAPALPKPVTRLQRLETQPAQALLDFVRGSELFALSYGLMDLGWEWCAPNEGLLAAAIEDGRAWWWQGAAEEARLLFVTGQDDEVDEIFPVLQLAAGSLRDLAASLIEFRRLAAHLGCLKAAWVAPCQPDILQALERAGFKRDWDNNLYVYEKTSG